MGKRFSNRASRRSLPPTHQTCSVSLRVQYIWHSPLKQGLAPVRKARRDQAKSVFFQSIIIADLRYSVKGTDGEEWPENTRFMGVFTKKLDSSFKQESTATGTSNRPK